MGTITACDGCGVDIQYLDRFHIMAASLERGTIQADLCPTCAQPFWDLPVGQKLVSDAKIAMEEEATRRAAVEEQMRLEEARKMVAQTEE